MDDTSRRLTRVIRVKKVLLPHRRDFLSDSEQSIQSEPNNAIRIIPKRMDPITLSENPLSVCYDRIIIDFLSSLFCFISLYRLEEFIDIKLNHINRILLELHLHCHKTAHKLLVQLYRSRLINHHYK